MTRRTTYALLTVLPGLVLAGAGLFHPHALTTATADTWLRLHLAGMFVFPLVGVSLVVPLGRRTDALAWVARLAAFVYAIAYNALDIISGVTAGYLTTRLPDGAGRPEEISWVFRIGTPVGEVGSWALLVAATLLVLDALRRLGARAAALLVLPLGAWLVHVDHIFAPEGVAGMALLGLGTGLATWWYGHDTQPLAARSQPNRGDARHSG